MLHNILYILENQNNIRLHAHTPSDTISCVARLLFDSIAGASNHTIRDVCNWFGVHTQTLLKPIDPDDVRSRCHCSQSVRCHKHTDKNDTHTQKTDANKVNNTRGI